MAKELPYFKFYCSEWSDGDVTLEDLQTQGLFINICAWYWSRECKISTANLDKKFSNNSQELNNIYAANLIKTKNGYAVISFLDEQMKDRKKLAKRNRQNGLRGGRPKTQSVNSGLAKNNPKLTNIEEKRREEKREDIEGRKAAFRKRTKDKWVELGQDKYITETEIFNFFNYWAEHGDNDKLMRFEKEKSFGIGRRLGTWRKNNHTPKNPNVRGKTI